MANQSNRSDWSEFSEGEEKLQELMNQDLVVAELAQTLQLKLRVEQLELEVAQLRALESVWLGNRISRLYFAIPRKLLRFLVKRPRGD